jgi:paraquat-inducible protein B
MSRSANPVAVGAFVLGTLLLAALLLIFFGGGRWWGKHERYVLIYETSIKGLNVGAPVTIKGVKIGQVAAIKARMSADSLAVFNNVVIEIAPNALEREGGGAQGEALMEELIKRGLRAQLRLQSLLTGLLYVDVDFHPDKLAVYQQQIGSHYKQIPTIPTDLEQLTRDLESIDINQLSENLQQVVSGTNQLINDPALQHMGRDIQQTLAAVRSAADTLRQQSTQLQDHLTPLVVHGDQVLTGLQQSLPPLTAKLDATLTALRQASDSLQQTSANTAFLTSEDSPLLYRIDTAAGNVNAAAEQVRRHTDMLERQPEVLLFGKPEGK